MIHVWYRRAIHKHGFIAKQCRPKSQIFQRIQLNNKRRNHLKTKKQTSCLGIHDFHLKEPCDAMALRYSSVSQYWRRVLDENDGDEQKLKDGKA